MQEQTECLHAKVTWRKGPNQEYLGETDEALTFFTDP